MFSARPGQPCSKRGSVYVFAPGKCESPSRENILAAFQWLVDGAKAGDSLFMHYSGHGGRLGYAHTGRTPANKNRHRAT